MKGQKGCQGRTLRPGLAFPVFAPYRPLGFTLNKLAHNSEREGAGGGGKGGQTPGVWLSFTFLLLFSFLFSCMRWNSGGLRNHPSYTILRSEFQRGGDVGDHSPAAVRSSMSSARLLRLALRLSDVCPRGPPAFVNVSTSQGRARPSGGPVLRVTSRTAGASPWRPSWNR